MNDWEDVQYGHDFDDEIQNSKYIVMVILLGALVLLTPQSGSSLLLELPASDENPVF